MKLPALFSILTISALTLGACAARSAPSTPPIAGPVARTIELPAAAGPGQPREVKVLLDEPALKLVTIILRQGTELPQHHAPVPVVIQALHGAGIVTAGGEQLRIDPTHPVLLAPDVPHAVTPDSGTDLVLLVQHLGPRDPAKP